MGSKIEDQWSLESSHDIEEKKHNERVKDAIRRNAKDIINSESVISTDPNGRKVKISIPVIKQRRFIWGRNEKTKGKIGGAGEAKGQNGDVLRPGDPKSGQKKDGAGREHGEHYYVEVDLEDVIQELVQQLGLPNLKKKSQKKIKNVSLTFDTYRPAEDFGEADIEESVINNIIRNAQITGKATVGNWITEDLVKVSYNEKIQHTTHAAVYLAMDVSGSMNDKMKAVAKMIFLWIVEFLKFNYESVDIHYVAHDTIAWEETEENFFKISQGGGTRCSSALEFIEKHLDENHPPADCNNYIIHFTDGDTWGDEDDSVYLELLKKLLKKCAMIGYGEISNTIGYESSGFVWSKYDGKGSDLYKKIKAMSEEEEFLLATLIRNKDEITKTLKFFFGEKKEK